MLAQQRHQQQQQLNEICLVTMDQTVMSQCEKTKKNRNEKENNGLGFKRICDEGRALPLPKTIAWYRQPPESTANTFTEGAQSYNTQGSN